MNNVSSTPSPPWAHYQDGSFFAARLLPRALGLRPLIKCYRQHLTVTDGPADFAGRALEALNISAKIHGGSLDSLPASGPLLLAANHPFGAAEGLVLAALFTRARPDLKIIVNHMLCRIKEMRPLFIPVNVLSARGDRRNISSFRAALLHLENGGALAVFPSGAVSHWHMRERRVIDPEWDLLACRLARIAAAPIVPLYFEGRNSILFQAAGCAHPILRTALLPRELWRMRGREIRMRIGKIVEPDLISALHDDKTRTAYIRACCYTLGRTKPRAAARRSVPIAARQPRESLLEEVGSLPPQRTIARDKKFRTLCLNCEESPRIMREVGRLREETFRAVHEGSGKALDIDRFDPHYIHLVLWDEEAGAVAGGYRARFLFPRAYSNMDGTLYTSSLFRFKKEFFEYCGASMELGRAFVTPEYQREYAPLLMLWKGICHLAVIGGARTLFGASSIGLGYTPESVHMLRQHLEERYAAPDLMPLVMGRRKPGAFSGSSAPDARGIEYKVLDRAVKGLEGGKGLPVLFKHYLQLGGRIAAFHEDRKFGTLDALMVVDLAAAPERLLLRYMGEERLRLLRMAHR